MSLKVWQLFIQATRVVAGIHSSIVKKLGLKNVYAMMTSLCASFAFLESSGLM